MLLEHFKAIPWTLCVVVVCKEYPLRSVMVDVGSMEGLFLETVPSDFVCKMFSLAIHYTFHYISHIFPNIITWWRVTGNFSSYSGDRGFISRLWRQVPRQNNINSQLDATITNFICNYNQLNIFRAIISPILGNNRSTDDAAAWSLHYTTNCKHGLVLLRMGKIIAWNMLSWL